MNKKFTERLAKAHEVEICIPESLEISNLFDRILGILFPALGHQAFDSSHAIEKEFVKLQNKLSNNIACMKLFSKKESNSISLAFFDKLEVIYDALLQDKEAIVLGDPAAKDGFEVVRAYPGFYAIAYYRMAHLLYELNVPYIPRILTEHVHSKTGIEIHPGAIIGNHFCIDHGTGIVIGETCIIGDRVKIYQGVTLGALSVSKDMASQKRHPTIENDVVIYAGATILGGDTIVGNHSVIGGNVWLTKSVPPHSRVYHQSTTKVKQ